MEDKKPILLDERIYLIDGFDLDTAARTGTYVINESNLTLIETGPSPSVKYIKKGLEDLGHSLKDVRYIVVTHVHLDHAGGAGLLLQDCPNATVVVHPKGARHLVDPAKLVAGARGVYGDSFNELFDPVLPVPEDRLIVKADGETLTIGDNCMLEFLDTPGHARHHFSIYDPISNGYFTGDTVGIRYQQLIDEGIDFFLPSTSPNHFDPNAMRASIDRIRDLKPDRIYYGHFGMTENVDQAFDQVSEWLDIFVGIGEEVVSESKGYDVLASRMLEQVKGELSIKGLRTDHDVYVLLNLDMQVCALGIIDYFNKLKQ
ncbi:Glyoxylase, beta-lactamase superfamily II [Lentibacillus persicus]|uniref:Glyoxylase, beta-lactamase superfamily II n=1 Tax=Lentibacillus persicus TaxID=640948 RepID=A0A1I1YAV7_9BACI|nr:MBL fold metallo-hydrolase [Lentibacillus persicus]SFE16755.1 Glyoxylase, beta-lactamase superfamily II [Lentibacillus persicus]